ncbi:hypothetical protein Lepto7375DRAFT_3242 [Leptolyngbya sp. PCC 7375]|nr:hypothetical protein Lepto7375DRAFT_3242 [Leptolyngbya sp. PCC 7375]
MSDTKMICLIGEQPVPNLLPILHCQPDEVILICISRTEPVKNNLTKVLRNYKFEQGHRFERIEARSIDRVHWLSVGLIL